MVTNRIQHNVIFPFVGLLVYEMNGGKKGMASYQGHEFFFVVADRSHHGYISTSSNKNVFRHQGYLPE